MIKTTAAGMALVLLFQLIPQAVGQQSPSDAATYSSRDPLPDSPGAVQSSSMRIQAMNQQEPGSAAPATSPNTAVQNADSDSDPSKLPADVESPGQAQSNSAGADKPETSLDSSQASAESQPPQRPQQPVGTAAAESVVVTGVAASRPAGVAVAPAKQRRVRSILIKVGAVVGVGVAVGATMALSQGSPSKPPGSH
jgi:hypothetical protein